MKRTAIKFAFLTLIFVFSLPLFCLARENVTDWYIKNFETEIKVNKDSSLLITERITADCGLAENKHGIFRILPTEIKTTEKSIKTPINLISITDFNNQPLKYSTSYNSSDKTITWKIGDPNRTVQGENYYQITYLVKNAIHFDQPNFDELYWNLSGSFWDLEIDNFTAKIIFPSEINQQNAQVDYYSGFLGEKDKSLASYNWLDNNTLVFTSNQTFLKRQGITASVIFPKNITLPYQPGFFEIYGSYLWFLMPLAVFFFCFNTWKKYGRDPKIDKTIIPEYDVPENLSPVEMGTLMTSGRFHATFVSSAIISFAVHGLVLIEEIPPASVFDKKDFRLTKTAKANEVGKIGVTEKLIMEKIFQDKETILLSSLKDKFYKELSQLKKTSTDNLVEKKLIVRPGFFAEHFFWGCAIICLFLGFWPLMAYGAGAQALVSSIISALIFALFARIMPKRTLAGAELMWKVKGFKLYMETAEKYRQQFYEKENIFEKFLPYAMIFGLTKIWIEKMKMIYGETYFQTYYPLWFSSPNSTLFDADSFATNINNLSTMIASNVVSNPSGAGGAGGVGGGGGGGGGGGW